MPSAQLELLRKLADGAPMEAYLGKHEGGYVAVQLSRPQVSGALVDAMESASAQAVERAFHPEVLAPSAVRRLPDGRMMAVSAPITGWTASDMLRTRGPIPEALALDWSVSTCEALSVLHDGGQVHGCLAPRHLHLEGDPAFPRARLFDTTLLHFRGGTSHEVDRATVVVEPEYLSPERAAGQRATPGSDVWGLGVLMFELLTGRPPFRERQPSRTRAAVLARPPLPALPRGLSRWRSVILGCLDPVEASRFASPLEVRQALAALV